MGPSWGTILTTHRSTNGRSTTEIHLGSLTVKTAGGAGNSLAYCTGVLVSRDFWDLKTLFSKHMDGVPEYDASLTKILADVV